MFLIEIHTYAALVVIRPVFWNKTLKRLCACVCEHRVNQSISGVGGVRVGGTVNCCWAAAVAANTTYHLCKQTLDVNWIRIQCDVGKPLIKLGIKQDLQPWIWAPGASCAEHPLATIVLAQTSSYLLFIDSLIRIVHINKHGCKCARVSQEPIFQSLDKCVSMSWFSKTVIKFPGEEKSNFLPTCFGPPQMPLSGWCLRSGSGGRDGNRSEVTEMVGYRD